MATDAETIDADPYLEIYGDPFVHQEMIRDRIRTKAYYNAICHNRHLFKDKIVMDVGCGTGILSLFAAKAGARRVIAVESSSIAKCTKQLMIDNKKDHIVTVIQDMLENVEELPHGIEKVDIIISEFMGHCLFWESMTESVIFARDKWLKPGGLIFPDICSLYIIGIWDPVKKGKWFEYWKNYKVKSHYTDMKTLINPFSKEGEKLDLSEITFDLSELRKAILRRPVCYPLGPRQIGTEECLLKTIDMNTLTIPELQTMVMPYRCKTTWDSVLHGMATYFTVSFSKCHKLEGFSTSPQFTRTHWKQTVFFFDKEMTITKGRVITGEFIMRKMQGSTPRDYEMELSVDYPPVPGDKPWWYTGMGFNETNTYYSYIF